MIFSFFLTCFFFFFLFSFSFSRLIFNSLLAPPCNEGCPDPTWTVHKWRTIAIIVFTFGLISLFFLTILIVHYLADPRCRHTKRFQLYSVSLLLRLSSLLPSLFLSSAPSYPILIFLPVYHPIFILPGNGPRGS